MLDNSIKLDLWPWVWKIGKAKAPDIHTLHITYLWFCGSCKFYLTNFVKSRKYKLCVMSATITRHEAKTWKFHCSVSAIKLYAQRTREWGRAGGREKRVVSIWKTQEKPKREKEEKPFAQQTFADPLHTLNVSLSLFPLSGTFHSASYFWAMETAKRKKKVEKKCFFFSRKMVAALSNISSISL